MRRQLTWIFALMTLVSQGQEPVPDSVLRLPEFEVSAARASIFLPGIKTEQLDTLLMKMRPSASVSAILSEHSGVLIRSYGTGGLATLSIRGTLSTQSGVLWNGFNLNQPNMGMTDLSLVPASFFDRIDIQSGGTGSVAGNGMIGGQLNLVTTPSFISKPEVTASAGIGSFGESHASLRFRFGRKKVASTTSVSRLVDRNHFPYTDLSGNRSYLEHALGSSFGALNQSALKLGRYSTISSGLWFQKSDREIPPTMVMQSNDQQQLDNSFRVSAQYSYITPVQRFQLRTAWFNESIHFTSPVALIDALYKLRNHVIESEYRRIFGVITLNTGGTLRLLRADVPYYSAEIRQQRGVAAYMSALYAHRSYPLRAALNLRKEWEDGYRVPWCPSLSVESDVRKNLNAKFTVSRNFRIPTMNDRFWVPGGNPDLKPESSWNQELNLLYSFTSTRSPFTFQLETGVYSMLVSNLIQWVNVSSTIWSPQNVSKVWSRGVEAGTRLIMAGKSVQTRLHLSYYYTPSTLQEAPNHSGKQLIYIPLHRFNLMADCSFQSFNALVSWSAMGKRFVNQENSDDLPWHALLNLTLQKSGHVKNTLLLLQLELSNLLNADYQVVKYYPEPGRFIKVNVQITI